MGLMLETSSDAPVRARAGRTSARRTRSRPCGSATIEDAGRLAIPFTTGHPRRDRRDRARARRVAVRDPRPPPALPPRPGGDRPELPGQARHRDARRARAGRRGVPGGRRDGARRPRTADARPGAAEPVRPEQQLRLLDAGINDWGGVSPLTPDHVNPERPWPRSRRSPRDRRARARRCASGSRSTREFARRPDPWLAGKMRAPVAALIGGRRARGRRAASRADRVAGPRRRRGSPGRSSSPSRRPRGAGLRADADGRLRRPRRPRDEVTRAWRGRDVVARAPRRRDPRRRSRKAERAPAAHRRRGARAVPGRGRRARGAVRGRRRPAARGGRATRSPTSSTATSTSRTSATSGAASARSRSARSTPSPTRSRSTRSPIAPGGVARGGATEVCMQGGIHPDLPGTFYFDLLDAVKDRGAGDAHPRVQPDGDPERRHEARRSRSAEFLQECRAPRARHDPRDRGRDPRRRRPVAPHEGQAARRHVGGDRPTAHELGIRSPRRRSCSGTSTRRRTGSSTSGGSRGSRRETGGFTEFVPLPFVHQNAPIYLAGEARPGATFEDNRADARGRADPARRSYPQRPGVVGEARRRSVSERS